MAKSCFLKSKRGCNTSKRKVQFYKLNKGEEDLRTERGIKNRQQRKEEKKMADHNREARITATLKIVRSEARAASLLRLCRASNKVTGYLNMLLDDFGGPNINLRVRLAAFRRLPNNRLENRSQETENGVLALHGVPVFEETFRAYLPSAVITCGSEDDSPNTRRRSRRRTRWRQTEENHRAADTH